MTSLHVRAEPPLQDRGEPIRSDPARPRLPACCIWRPTECTMGHQYLREGRVGAGDQGSLPARLGAATPAIGNHCGGDLLSLHDAGSLTLRLQEVTFKDPTYKVPPGRLRTHTTLTVTAADTTSPGRPPCGAVGHHPRPTGRPARRVGQRRSTGHGTDSRYRRLSRLFMGVESALLRSSQCGDGHRVNLDHFSLCSPDSYRTVIRLLKKAAARSASIATCDLHEWTCWRRRGSKPQHNNRCAQGCE